MQIYFVTGNKHKFLEIQNIFLQYNIPIELIMAPSWKKIEIQAHDLKPIAETAARYLSKEITMPFFIEDAGLFIEALKGFPGPYSHYVYKTLGITGILKLMEGIDNRSAVFKSVIALHINGKIITFEGRTTGHITYEPRGSHGFGFDPIFVPEGTQKTYAEMTLEEKNMYSHRSKATKKMLKFLLSILQE